MAAGIKLATCCTAIFEVALFKRPTHLVKGLWGLLSPGKGPGGRGARKGLGTRNKILRFRVITSSGDQYLSHELRYRASCSCYRSRDRAEAGPGVSACAIHVEGAKAPPTIVGGLLSHEFRVQGLGSTV